MTIENTQQSSNTANAATTKSELIPTVETILPAQPTGEHPQLEELAQDAILLEDRETTDNSTPSSFMSETEAAQLLIELSDAQERAAKFSEEKKLIYEQLMRRQAEFENFRKRVERERLEVNLQARANVVLEFLPVLDNLERALESVPKSEAVSENILMGVKLIHRQFLDVLIGLGLSPIKALGEVFDPHMHEAVTTEINSELPENTVIAELQKGYKLGEKLLRPSMVKVTLRG